MTSRTMNFLEDVPFRMTISFVDASMGEESFVHPPEFEMPNCADILMCAMYDFSLEKKVLYWIDSASREDIPWYQVTTDVVPTAPPCWLLLVDSKENLADGSETTGDKAKALAPVRRCVRHLTALETFNCARNKNQPPELVSKDLPSEECSDGAESSSTSCAGSDGEEGLPSDNADHIPKTLPHFLSLPQCRPKTSPGPLATPVESSCPKPPLLKQRRSMFLFSSMKLEGAKKKLAALMHPLNQTSTESTLASRAFSLHQRSRSSRNLRYGSSTDVSLVGALTPTPPSTCSPRPQTAAGLVPPVQKHKPTIASLSPYSCLPPLPGVQQPFGFQKAHPDSTADLLSALSREERDLIEPVLALGYPIRRAILALQKNGKQSLGQFLSYLSACDKLLKQGYEEAQVEEAMEMFQNSEKKATEFLHLLAQFNDMGFQQADIKEVLLLCENHRDLALEELMTRTQ